MTQGKQQAFPVDRSLLDGSYDRLAESGNLSPHMTSDHWGYLFYLYSCLRGGKATVWAGPVAAAKHCSFPFNNLKSPCDSLYGPLVESGLVTRGEVNRHNSVMVREYHLLTLPILMPDGVVLPGQPFTHELLRTKKYPFVTLPQDIVRGPWATLEYIERRGIGALYAFLTPDNVFGDPNHIMLYRGRLIASDAFQRAIGCDTSQIHRVLMSLQTKGLLGTADVVLAEPLLFPGSRPPLIVHERGDIKATLFMPTLKVKPKRPSKRSAE